MPQMRSRSRVVETAVDINDLQLGKHPGKLFVVARSIQQRSDASFEPVLLRGVHELSLHPFGSHRIGGKHEYEPIAALERSADFVLQLLGTLNLGVAIPHRNLVVAQNADQPLNKRLISVRMRDRDVRPQVRRPPTCAQARLRSASAMGLTSGSSTSGFGRSTQRNCRTILGISPFGRCSRPPTATGVSRLL